MLNDEPDGSKNIGVERDCLNRKPKDVALSEILSKVQGLQVSLHVKHGDLIQKHAKCLQKLSCEIMVVDQAIEF